MATEKQKYLDYIEGEKKKGLVDVHFLPGQDARGADEEAVYRELNTIVRLQQKRR